MADRERPRGRGRGNTPPGGRGAPRGDGPSRGQRGGSSDRGGGGYRGRGDTSGRGDRGFFQDRGAGPQRGRGGRGADTRGGFRGGRGGGGGSGADVYSEGEVVFRSVVSNYHLRHSQLTKASPSASVAPPDPIVQEKENQNIPASKLSLKKLDLSGTALPLRPGYGKEGQPFVLRTNYFKIEIKKQDIFRYTVAYKKQESGTKTVKGKGPARGQGSATQTDQPQSLGPRKRRVLFTNILRDPFFNNASLRDCLATDYAQIILSTKRLDLGPTNARTFDIVYREIDGSNANRSPDNYEVQISHDMIIKPDELLRYLAALPSDESEFPEKGDAVQALNIIISRAPNENPRICQSGQNKFFESPEWPNMSEATVGTFNLTGALMAIRGYYSSVRTSTNRILLNVNAQCTAFYPAIPLLELMSMYGVNAATWMDLERFLRGLRVRTSYLKDAQGKPEEKIKTIQGFSHRTDRKGDARNGNASTDHGDSNQISFKNSEGVELTINQYFKRQHSIQLAIPQSWVLNCGSFDKPVWIPPELCHVVQLQPFRHLLSDSQTAAMIKMAARPPAENARRIVGAGLRVLGISQDGRNAGLTKFGISVDPNMITVPARKLMRPTINYSESSKSKTASAQMRASWNLADRKFVKAGKVRKWGALLVAGAPFSAQDRTELIEEMKKLGMAPGDPRPLRAPIADPRDERSVDDGLKAIFEDVAAQQEQPDFLLVVLPYKSTLIYNRCKFLADTRYGVQTVSVVAANTGKGSQFWANVAMKINLKCGGTNHTIPQNQLRFLVPKDAKLPPTMVIGIDVSHPSVDSVKNAPSIAAVVASVDKQYAHWPSSMKTNPPRQEMVDKLAEMVAERVHYFVKVNGKAPVNVLIYRDGRQEGLLKPEVDANFQKVSRKANTKRFSNRSCQRSKME